MNKFILSLSALLLLACGSESTEQQDGTTAQNSVIAPPLEGDFANDTVFTIDPSVYNRVETPNGSSLEIPANCLVDAKGKEIKKNVDISFSQYHSMADIISSGIPMTYDTLNQHFTFESAGMFTVKGFFNEGEEAFVKDSENIGVNLASDKDEKFNFYELDESSGKWDYDKTSATVENPKFDPAAIPMEPEKANEDAFVLDLDLDKSQYKELDQFNEVVWEYCGDNDSLDPRKNKWTASERWSDFELTATNEAAFEYNMTMSNSNKKFVTKVKAALTGEDFNMAMADFGKKKKEVAREMDNIQKPYIRSVAIRGFGTYNYDYYHQMDAPQQILADFDFGKYNSEKELAMVVVLYPGEDVCINYPQDSWKDFALDKNAETKMLAILPENKVAVFNGNLSSSYGKKEFTFQMDVLDKPCSTKDDLNDIISDL